MKRVKENIHSPAGEEKKKIDELWHLGLSTLANSSLFLEFLFKLHRKYARELDRCSLNTMISMF